MPNQLKIFKQSSRYSEIDRPALHERCFFSHALALTRNEFIPFARNFERSEIHQNAICEVKKHHPHVIEVLFDGASQTDFVSPEFLLSIELTPFGEELAGAIGQSAAEHLFGEPNE